MQERTITILVVDSRDGESLAVVDIADNSPVTINGKPIAHVRHKLTNPTITLITDDGAVFQVSRATYRDNIDPSFI
jgi:hypothetical protein